MLSGGINSSTWGDFIEVDHWIALTNDSEVVSRYLVRTWAIKYWYEYRFTSTNFSTGGSFYTDNGLEMQERQYQSNPLFISKMLTKSY